MFGEFFFHRLFNLATFMDWLFKKGATVSDLSKKFLVPNCKGIENSMKGGVPVPGIGRNQGLGITLWKTGSGASFLISCFVNLQDGKLHQVVSGGLQVLEPKETRNSTWA